MLLFFKKADRRNAFLKFREKCTILFVYVAKQIELCTYREPSISG